MLRVTWFAALAGALLAACDAGRALPDDPASLGTTQQAVTCSGPAGNCKCGSATCANTAYFCSTVAGCSDNTGGNHCCQCTSATLGCGSDCVVCSLANASGSTCSGTASAGAVACNPVCLGGFANLSEADNDGCEASCNTAANCGLDCLPCLTPAGTTANSCTGNTGGNASAKCSPTCAAGYADFDGNKANGCEVCNTGDRCGSDCADCLTNPGTTTNTCAGGNAVPASTSCNPGCAAGYQNLDGDKANGCEACTTQSTCGLDCLPCQTNAGTTANTCSGNTGDAAQACNPTCAAGYADIDGNKANGCEACATGASCGLDCGACLTPAGTTSNPCAGGNTGANAAVNCEPTCAASGGYVNADGDDANGCEACNTSTLCGLDCQPCLTPSGTGANACTGNTGGNASAMCDPTCQPGYKDSDGNKADGCEICDTPATCGTDCGACLSPTGTTANPCAGGNSGGTAAANCEPTCATGFQNFDGNDANGCEACATGDHCGTDCGDCLTPSGTTANACPGGNASGTATTNCSPTCAAGFKDTDSNKANGCEACSTASVCGLDCLPCQAPTGTTGNACTGNTGGNASAKCSPTCATGYRDSDGDKANGCEICNTGATCGTDCAACQTPSGTTANTCPGGNTGGTASANCNPTCASGFKDTDANKANGCEACSNATVCGLDCQPCAVPIGTTGNTCTGNTGGNASTKCSPSCASGYQDYDGNKANGCEICSNGDHCGTDCGDCLTPAGTTANTCPGGNTGGTAAANCSPTCASGYKDVDTSKANGCEACSTSAVCGLDCQPCLAPTGTTANACTGNTGGNASAKCNPTCALGYKDSDANKANGCEICNTGATCGTDCLACQTPAGTTSNQCTGGHSGGTAAANCNPACASGYKDTDGNKANGCEACTTATTCGLDCQPCARPTGTTANACTGNLGGNAVDLCNPTCAAGYKDVDANRANGCEACSTSATCGLDCNPCLTPTGTASNPCSGNLGGNASANCSPSCQAGYRDTDANRANGCEACSTSATCGLDCNPCLSPAGTAANTCTGNLGGNAVEKCSPTCAAGYANLDNNKANGCEACSTATTCGLDCKPCLTPTGTTSNPCSGNLGGNAAAKCSPSCQAGYRDTDSDKANGCEACSTSATCGLDCNPCLSPAGTTANTCTGNLGGNALDKCSPTCAAGFANLDANKANGCEACASAAACGQDCQPCLTPPGTNSNACAGGNAGGNASANCSPSCAPGFRDLDGNKADGCEACSTSATCGLDCQPCQTNAGTTANACSSNTAGNAVDTCRPTCAPGFADLDGNKANGCEARCDTVAHCGTDCAACPVRSHSTPTCSGNGAASSAACGIACDPGYLNTDNGLANGCEAPCTSEKACGRDCQPCAAEHTDAITCPDNTVDAKTACQPVCSPGYLTLDDDNANGCEFACDTPVHCGTDCSPCETLHAAAGTSCAGGNTEAAALSCKPACDPGWSSTDGDGSDGCETSCNTAGLCGSDCRACEESHVTANPCAGGNGKLAAVSCEPVCEDGWLDLDANGASGCETPCTDSEHCGLECIICSRENAATVTCASNTLVAAAACQPACTPGYQNVDKNGLNGCEEVCDQPDYCGTSCEKCPERPNAVITCAGPDKQPAQACVATCKPGWTRPDQYGECETPCTAIEHCGSDCAPCLPAVHADPACLGRELPSSEACGLACHTGYADLDTQKGNGCEGCAQGYYDVASSAPALCERCVVDEHCGTYGEPYCRNCFQEWDDGLKCVSSRCGCNTKSDCPDEKDCQHHTCVKPCTADGNCLGAGEKCCGPAGQKVCLVQGAEYCDGRDNDCNGVIDDKLDDATAPPCEKQEGVCQGSRIACVDGLRNDCDDAVYAAHSADYEVTESRCDGQDNDCNGQTDEPAKCGRPDASLPPPRDAGTGFNGETFDLGGCGCQQAAGPTALASLAVLLGALAARRRRRG